VSGYLIRQNRDLFLGWNVARAELNHKSIHLSFGQRVSSVRLHGVLCGNYEEQFRERIRVPVYTDLMFPIASSSADWVRGEARLTRREDNVAKIGPL